jgi:hypothetical protein
MHSIVFKVYPVYRIFCLTDCIITWGEVCQDSQDIDFLRHVDGVKRPTPSRMTAFVYIHICFYFHNQFTILFLILFFIFNSNSNCILIFFIFNSNSICISIFFFQLRFRFDVTGMHFQRSQNAKLSACAVGAADIICREKKRCSSWAEVSIVLKNELSPGKVSQLRKDLLRLIETKAG